MLLRDCSRRVNVVYVDRGVGAQLVLHEQLDLAPVDCLSSRPETHLERGCTSEGVTSAAARPCRQSHNGRVAY